MSIDKLASGEELSPAERNALVTEWEEAMRSIRLMRGIIAGAGRHLQADELTVYGDADVSGLLRGGYKQGETFTEILDDTLNPSVLDAFTVADAGGLNITWTAGEVYTPAKNIVEVTAGSGTCTDNTVNYLYWDTGTTLTLSTTESDSGDIPVAHIYCQAGDIWELHVSPAAETLTRDIQHGLEELFEVAVADGCLVSGL